MVLGFGVFVRGFVVCRDSEVFCFFLKSSKGYKVCREIVWFISYGIYSLEVYR